MKFLIDLATVLLIGLLVVLVFTGKPFAVLSVAAAVWCLQAGKSMGAKS